ncbi:MAG: SCP2 sterol-binding domain-containing protein [Alphaproteobacteria bacterium]|nr:SCP2 sterol-binding domain-containing protein [Alphaproteobacteria bacterium]
MEKSLPRLRPLEHLARWTLHAVLDRHPEIFDRLGDYAACRYLIDVKDTPFVLLLIPGERDIRIHLRSKEVRADAAIRGSFMTLAQLAQGGGDGDALFFSRDITIEGDTEAVLALRNALDDADLDIIHDSFDALGFWGSPLRFGYRAFKEMKPLISGMFAP